MAFPFTVSASKNFTPEELQKLRQAFIETLFSSSTSGGTDAVANQLAQITRILGRSAGNETTVYDNGSARSASSRTSSLTRQVEQAITQVLGRAPGRGPDGFISALNSAFPTATNGQVLTTPARSLVSLHSPTEANGLTGQLSVEQANLYRQASIIGQDALKVLDGLKAFDPTADVDAVEALRSLVRSQIRTVIDEFGRLDEPRKQRVETYLNTLSIKNSDNRLVGGFLFQMGEKARLINGSDREELVLPVTIEDETQIAGFELLVSYVNTLKRIWDDYNATTSVEIEVTGRYSERLSRASIMLPVIADSNANFTSALDSIGFSESERRSDAALFTTLDSPAISLSVQAADNNLSFSTTTDVILPDITVNDFDEWVDRFTSLEAPSLLATSGQFGLDFVTDQADTLFWTIGSVLLAISSQPRNQASMLGKALAFERVQQTLSELVFQLDTLADLGVGSISAVNATRPAPSPPVIR